MPTGAALDHVVVLGAGVAGLAAARAAAARADRVTLVERDRLPDHAVARPGIPQARHVHALLVRGARELEQMFPGLRDELVAEGAHDLDWTTQRFRSIAGWSPRFVSGLRSVQCTRDLLEARLRRRVLALPAVEPADGLEAVGLTGDATRVTGVRLRGRGRTDVGLGPHRDLRADLVVDATGRGSRSFRWLAHLGLQEPAETVVASHLGYASRTYAVPDGFDADWRMLAVRSPAPSSRAAVLYPVEGDRWFVTLSGQGADVPPHDDAGFAAFASSVPGVADALGGARPLGRVATYRRTENRWRHWDRLPGWPDGVVVLGDAVCAFNPVYGQGMTVATVQARLLLEELGTDSWGPGRSRRLQQRVAGVLRDPWTLATQEDFRYPDTVGTRSALTRVVHAYTDRVLRAAVEDVVVSRRFFEVAHLVEPARALMAPGIVARVLTQG